MLSPTGTGLSPRSISSGGRLEAGAGTYGTGSADGVHQLYIPLRTSLGYEAGHFSLSVDRLPGCGVGSAAIIRSRSSPESGTVFVSLAAWAWRGTAFVQSQRAIGAAIMGVQLVVVASNQVEVATWST